jgi:hypothetical protein
VSYYDRWDRSKSSREEELSRLRGLANPDHEDVDVGRYWIHAAAAARNYYADAEAHGDQAGMDAANELTEAFEERLHWLWRNAR